MEKDKLTITIEDMSAEGQGIGKLYELAAPDKTRKRQGLRQTWGRRRKQAPTGGSSKGGRSASRRKECGNRRAVDRATGMAQNRAEAVQTGRGFAILLRTRLSAIVYASN